LRDTGQAGYESPRRERRLSSRRGSSDSACVARDASESVFDRVAKLLRWGAVFVAGAGLLGVRAVRQPDAPDPTGPIEVAITVDDLPRPPWPQDGVSAQTLLDKLDAAFAEHHLPPVTGFVNGRRLEEHPEDRAALQRWVRAGNLLGNHTYSHTDLAKVSLAQYTADIEKNEALLTAVQGAVAPGRDWRVFRYPYLQEGPSQPTRESLRDYLFKRGYRIAEVTVDFEDWQWFPIFTRCAAAGDERAIDKLRARYRRAARDTLLDSDRLARDLFGRRIRQVLLLHSGSFTAEMIDDLLDEYEAMTPYTIRCTSSTRASRAAGAARSCTRSRARCRATSPRSRGRPTPSSRRCAARPLRAS
jgi:peptidoglycan-N-acetylglucosamine deacetylase